MDHVTPLNQTASTFLQALAAAQHERKPFDHWILEDILPAIVCDQLIDLPFAPPGAPAHDGRRESNNAARVYFNPDIQAAFPVCRELVDGFSHYKVLRAIEQATGTDLAHGQLRIEYAQDVDGFWLEPHVDIPVKLFTMLVYLSDSPELHDAGTDIYDASPQHRLVKSAPYEWNAGLIFIPGQDTWHGFTKRPIRGVRKSIIINYVSPAWRAVEELARPVPRQS